MRLVVLSLLIVSLGLAACDSGGTSNSDAPAGQSANNSNQSGAMSQPAPPTGAAPSDAAPGALSTPATSQPLPAPSQPAQAQLPAFFDQKKKQIKDVPVFPGAMLVNMQYGPLSGVDTVLMVFQTGKPLEKITAFYEDAIKANKWTVTRSTDQPETYVRQLKKGETSEGLIQVKKSPETGVIEILLNRIERPAQPKQ